MRSFLNSDNIFFYEFRNERLIMSKFDNKIYVFHSLIYNSLIIYYTSYTSNQIINF